MSVSQAAAQTGFEPDGTPPKEVRLILRDSAPVNLVRPWLSNGMFYGWLRLGPYKIVGVDSVPAARVLCLVLPDNRLHLGNALSFVGIVGGVALAAVGANMPDEWMGARWTLGPELVAAGGVVAGLAASASVSPARTPTSCAPPP